MQPHDHVESAVNSFLPHGFCYLWNPGLLWTHVVSDLLIGVAYVTISISLAWLVHSVRRDIPFSWVFVAFGLFIITCGATHFMEIWTLWHPDYWLSGGVKVVTAVASVATAVALPFTVPRAVATVRDARLARDRELAQARADALQAQNELLQEQAQELEVQRADAEQLSARLEDANTLLRDALAGAETARQAAESASHAKSVFLRTMSHELRTPLNAIIGYEQLLEDGVTGPVTPEQVEQLRRIGRSASHLLGLIDEILTLARSSDAPGDLRLTEVSLPALIDEVVVMVEPQARSAGLTLQTEAVPPIGMTTDAGRLRQILLNLLSNAIKFTPTGAVALSVSSESESVVFRVRDTGPGIQPDQLEQVFEPFWQAEQGMTRRHGGSGLGLTVSRALAALLGGSLTADNAPEGGAVFTLRLPQRLHA
jgi:signal transduction histidine kinase